MDPITLILVFIVGLTSAFIGGLAGGGGGLISIPALIFLGLPANVAVATNRFGVIGGISSMIYKFGKAKMILYNHAIPFIILSAIGSYIGANILLQIDVDLLTRLIGGFLLIMLPLIFIKKDWGLARRIVDKKWIWTGYAAYFLIGIYDGFLGAGAGIIVTYLFVMVLGLTMIEANALDKLAYIINPIISVIIFAINGLIHYESGIVLIIGAVLGGYLGAHTAIKKGNYIVKLSFSVIVVASAIKLLFF